MTAFIALRHRNIRRLCAGTEPHLALHKK